MGKKLKDDNIKREELIKLSPSGLYSFTECKSCFWIDYHISGPAGLPWALNMAMDSILKVRYDYFREKGEFPPEVKDLKKQDVQLFTDIEKLNNWRSSVNYLKVINEKMGYELRGKIDDVFVEKDGRLIPADYKSSGYAPKEDKQKYYRFQLAAYGYMFKNAGYKVSDRAYLLHYFVTDAKNHEIPIPFSGHIDKVDISSIDIPEMLKKIVKLLRGPYPGLDPKCENCEFYKDVHLLLKKSK